MVDDTEEANPLAETVTATAVSDTNWTEADVEAGTADLGQGSTIARYEIRGELGRGGMGTVYRADDPRLGREVAIKLLRGRGVTSDVGTKRLQREAQALAKLSHPNIVAVYDLDTHDDQVFIAMELVEGVTLRDWLKQGKRPLKEVVAAFAEAGAGLAAAHAEGLVHRDFKPANVIVGNDGRIRVLDFGLAGLLEADADVEQTDVDVASGNPQTLTRHGAIMGTPAYMAPEQHQGAGAVPATDQFAFCVALYEAVYQQHPYGGSTAAEIARRVTDGARVPTPDDKGAPGWLRELLLKGMAAEPGARFETMKDLLAELTMDRSPRRRGPLLVAAGAVGLGIAGIVAFSLASSGKSRNNGNEQPSVVDSCSGVARKLDEAWNPSLKAALNKNAPERVRGAVVARLDKYANTWREHRLKVCKQRDEAYSSRVQCLDGARAALKSVVGILSTAKAHVFDNAAGVLNNLPAIEECDRPAAAVNWHVAPADDNAAKERVRIKAKTTRAMTLRGTNPKKARSLAKELEEELPRMTDPLARAHALRGVAMISKKAKGAEPLLRRAIVDAIAVRDEVHVVLCYSDLIGGLLDRRLFKVAIREADLAAAHNERMKQFVKTWPTMGVWYSLFGGRIAMMRGLIEMRRGKPLAAIPHHEKSVRLWEKTAKTHPAQLTQGLNNLADALRTTGQYGAAIKMFDRAVVLSEKEKLVDLNAYLTVLSNRAATNVSAGWLRAALGDFSKALALAGNRSIAGSLAYNLAGLYALTGELKKSEKNLEFAKKLWLKLVGPKHHLTHVAELLTCTIERHRGDTKKALTVCNNAVAGLSKKVGAGHPYVASARVELALVLVDRRKYAAGRGHAKKALAIYAKTTGLKTMEAGVAQAALGRALMKMGNSHAVAAGKQLRAAIATFDGLKLPSHPSVIPPLVDLAELLLRQGDKTGAHAITTRALTIANAPAAVIADKQLKRLKALAKQR